MVVGLTYAHSVRVLGERKLFAGSRLGIVDSSELVGVDLGRFFPRCWSGVHMSLSSEIGQNERTAAEHYVEVERALRNQLPKESFLWYNPPGESRRPTFVALSPEIGLFGLNVYDWSPSDISAVTASSVRTATGVSHDPVGDLGRSLEGIRELLNGASVANSLAGLVVLPRLTGTDFQNAKLERCIPPDLAICADVLCSGQLSARLADSGAQLTGEELDSVRDRLYPETHFDLITHVTVEGRQERMQKRIRLDAIQEGCARSISNGVTALCGVAGSGKSLVLAARARLLAESHPDWNIQLLCFNNSLVSYLQRLVGPSHPSIRVSTFHSWTRQLGLWLPFVNSEEKAERERKRLLGAIEDGVGRESLDAILIDEGQDFRGPWIQLIESALCRRKGGLLFAVDAAQSIYQVSRLDELFDEDIEVVSLDTNYRNTEEIGRFAYSTVFDVTGEQGLAEGNPYQPRLPQFGLSGEPVQVVWGESWNAQAEFIAREAKRLVNEGRASYRDIAVLYPKRSGTKRIPEAFEAEGIPHYVLATGAESRDGFDLEEDCVKVMTAHSAKGLEFPVVFLFGGEATAVPENLADATDEEANRARVLFVATTRATDLLYVTYTRPNLLIDRAQHLPWAEVRRYPDDYAY